MRNTKKDKRIFAATKDYYGPGVTKDVNINKVALHITGRKLMTLDEQLKHDVNCIRSNMQDALYMESILK